MRPDVADSECIDPARVRVEGDSPYSLDYQDIYHSADAEREVERVFIDPCGLTEAVRQPGTLWVGELGFGSGLNFAVLAALCMQHNRPLHLVSCDAAPLHPQTFADIAQKRSKRLPIYAELAQAYPPLIQGWHRRHLAGGLITLSLYWGDAQSALAHLSTHAGRRFHAWFLDGFAPDRNTGMWAPELMTKLGAVCAPNATVATFTSAGRVRRALDAAGFAMRRVDQRPHKRESLAGIYRATGQAPARQGPRQATVVGAGLAGACVARALAEREVAVRVLEAGDAAAGGASSIPLSMLHGRLLADGSSEARLRCHAYLYSSHRLRTLGILPDTGALQVPAGNMTPQRLRDLAEHYGPTGSWLQPLDRLEGQQRIGWALEHDSLWFPDSQGLDMPSLCKRLLDHAGIEFIPNTPVDAIATPTEHPLILAAASASSHFPATRYLELSDVHGQVDMVTMETPPLASLLGNGYVTPGQTHWTAAVGSTYEYTPWDASRATEANLQRLPESQRAGAQSIGHARATRCVSSDRLPVVGDVYDQNHVCVANVHVLTALGSMGNVYSHYAGEVLASQICGEFPPADESISEAWSSLRFRRRQARRGYRLGAQP